ncbi:hypothetical protein OPV22_013769 [Ensete ventricosum]|uniref:Uncharacterized protein n=1 Tax=Ensete ventricosum TaxID=4639 RepID=A0AAV8R1R0_ENSVE|nr:hypothetical protein OPV22_013769 [Ensete ventricosum]
MASEQIIRGIYRQYIDYYGDDDEPRAVATPAGYFAGDVREFSSCNLSRRTSRLSLKSEGDDADAEASSEEEDVPKGGGGGALLEGSDKDSSLGVGGGVDARHARPGSGGWSGLAQGMKKSHAEDGPEAASGECRLVVRPRCGSGRMCMDMEEVRACRDLGLDLPSDWTVEIPGTFTDPTADTSSGGNSPIHWRISSPGDDPRDVKAKLKVWAQAVALTSASRLNG